MGNLRRLMIGSVKLLQGRGDARLRSAGNFVNSGSCAAISVSNQFENPITYGEIHCIKGIFPGTESGAEQGILEDGIDPPKHRKFGELR
jgi:hypothetical protein